MDKYIIKGAGTMDEILTALKAVKMVLGGNARLTDLAIGTRYARIYTEQTQQLELLKEHKKWKRNTI